MKLKLALIREQKGFTQSEIARVAKVSPKTEWNWEQEKSFPNAAQIWDICTALGCTPNDLLGWYDEHPRDGTAPLAEDESNLLTLYRSSTPDRRSRIVDTARDFALASGGVRQRDVGAEGEVA